MSEYSDVVNQFTQRSQSAGIAAVTSIDDDPEQAARAMKLSEASGADPSAIYANVEGFDRQFQGHLTSEIVGKNSHLQDYINAHPMAAKVSNGDWASLDTISRKLSQFSTGSILSKFVDKYKEGVGPGGLGSYIDEEHWQKAPFSSALLAAEGAVFEFPIRNLTGLFEGGMAAVEEAGKQFGLDDTTAYDLSRDVRAAVEAMGFTHAARGPGIRESTTFNKGLKAAAEPKNIELANQWAKAQEAIKAAEPWLLAGEEPPFGIHPEIDKLKLDQTKNDLKILDEALKESQGSATRERSQELFSTFVRQHPEAKIGISADAIRKLYGGKEPTPEDNLLGWVPNIGDRLREAEAIGGDVEVSWADWLTHMEPEVAKELKDNLRMRPGGVTLEEAKTLKEATTELAQEEDPEAKKFEPNKYKEPEEAANQNKSQQQIVEELPPPKEKLDRIWDNYVKRMSPEEMLDSEPVWSTAKLLQEEQKIPEHEAFAQVANDMYRRMGANKFLSPSGARRYMAEARGIKSIRDHAGLDPVFEEEESKQLKLKKVEGKFDDAVHHTFAITDQQGRGVGQLLLNEQHEGLDLNVEWIGGTPQAMTEGGGPGKAFGPKLIRSVLEQLKTEFPKAEFLSGFRVSGAREKAGKTGQVRIPIKQLMEELSGLSREGATPLLEQLKSILGEGEFQHVSKVTAGFVPKKWSPRERQAISEATILVNRILPKQIDVMATRGIVTDIGKDTERQARGYYAEYDDAIPIIMFSLEQSKPLGTVRHEAIHALYRGGFFSDSDWETLTTAAKEGGWVEKHDIHKRYSGADDALKLEEAIAEEYKDWGNRRDAAPKVQRIFEEIRRVLAQIRKKMTEVLGYTPTADELFELTEAGDIAKRKATPRNPKSFRGAAEEEPEKIARPASMSKKEYDKYLKGIAKQKSDDMAYALKKAEEVERKKQTREWKENEAKVRDEVAKDINERPDVNAANFFRNGILYGEDTHTRPKLNEKYLTQAQIDALPESLVNRTGLHPDDAAGLFGYQSGDAMIDHLISFENSRGEMSTTEFTNALIKNETEERMQARFGSLDENILREAREHVLSDNTADLLHQETVAIGKEAGIDHSMSKAEAKEAIEKAFGSYPVKGLSQAKFFNLMGKSAKLQGLALLDGDKIGAFKEALRREYSFLFAKEAAKFEKEQKKFEAQAKRLATREPAGIKPEYTNFVHDIMQRVGLSVRRSIQDVQTEINAGLHKTLEKFVKAKQKDGFIVPVADFLFDPSYRKPIEEMTVNEFRAVNDSITTLAKNGREEQKLIRAGDKIDFNEGIDKMTDQMKTLPEKDLRVDIPEGIIKRAGKVYWAASLTIESIMNRFDRGNARGIFNQTIVRPFSEAANNEAALEKKFGRRYSSLPPVKEMNKKVKNWLFVDPRTGQPMVLSRKNVLAILQNAGNAENFQGLLDGYKISPDKQGEVMQWLFENTTKEDWDRAQALGNIFKDAKRLSDGMYRELSGVASPSVAVWKIDTPFGKYDGWYHPIIYDKSMPQKSEALFGPNILEDNHFQIAPGSGYTKSRTGYVGPYSLDFDQVPARLQQVLHDVAFRPTVIQLGKIFKNGKFRETMNKHFGEHYTNLLIPFLKDIAGVGDTVSEAQHVFTQSAEFFRQNIIAHLVGLNPSTFVKHNGTALVNSVTQVGIGNYIAAQKSILSHSYNPDMNNWQFAMNKSEELQRRHRNWMETVRGSHESVFGNIAASGDLNSFLSNFTDRPLGEGARLAMTDLKGKYMSIRQSLMWIESAPLAYGDLFSAVPTWLAQYAKSKKLGLDEGQSVFEADRAVRQAHGSTAITNRPAIMRGNPFVQSFTSFYGFFSHILQREYETAWATKEALTGGQYYKDSQNYKVGKSILPVLAGMYVSYAVWPAVWEEMVSPMHNDKNDSTAGYMAKVGLRGLSSSFIGIRDLAHGLIEGGDTASAGLFGTAMQTGTRAIHDLGKAGKSLAMKNMLDFNAVFGMMTGLTNASVPRMGAFAVNDYNGRERPQNLREFWRGITTGTSKEKKR